MADDEDGCSATREAQDEELCALEAIFADDCQVDRAARLCTVWVPSRRQAQHVQVTVHLPSDYPHASPPLVELHAPHVPEDLLTWASDQLLEQFSPGEPVVYSWVEWLRECEELHAEAAPPHDPHDPHTRAIDATPLESVEALQARAYDAELAADPEAAARAARLAPLIISGEPVTERKSTFQAHVCPVDDVADVSCVMELLLRNNKVRNATHNIMAYRFHPAGRDTFLQDYDDDGETAAGGRLLQLLQAADVSGVVVVVSRWFGGVLLGPSRFSHINNTARALLLQCGYIKAEGGRKRGKHKG